MPVNVIVDQHHKPEVTQIVDVKGNTLRLEAKFPYEIRENENSWIAYSPHFKTFGYSRLSEEDATKKFRIAIDTFFQVHINRGTVEKALLSLKWSYRGNNIIFRRRIEKHSNG